MQYAQGWEKVTAVCIYENIIKLYQLNWYVLHNKIFIILTASPLIFY